MAGLFWCAVSGRPVARSRSRDRSSQVRGSSRSLGASPLSREEWSSGGPYALQSGQGQHITNVNEVAAFKSKAQKPSHMCEREFQQEGVSVVAPTCVQRLYVPSGQSIGGLSGVNSIATTKLVSKSLRDCRALPCKASRRQVFLVLVVVFEMWYASPNQEVWGALFGLSQPMCCGAEFGAPHCQAS